MIGKCLNKYTEIQIIRMFVVAHKLNIKKTTLQMLFEIYVHCTFILISVL